MSTLQTTSDDFLLHCRVEKHLSPKTIKAYTTDLQQFTAFIRSGFTIDDISFVNKQHIREYMASIETLKPKSVKRKIATIKALFNYLEFEDRITINPLRKMRIRIKEPLVLPAVMDIQEIMKIFKVGYKQKGDIKNLSSYGYEESIRNIVVLELLFSTGARVSEVAGLKLADINLQTGAVIIKGKGNKERVIQVCNKESLTILKNYYSLCQEKIKDAGGYFLVNRFKRPLSDQSIRNLVKRLVSSAGIKRRITPHTFRHSFATLLLEKDVDIKYIQSLLGHSSINTTQIYTHVNRKRQRQLLTTRHPRREFSMMISTE